MRRLLLSGALLVAAPLHTQSLASRIASAGDGAVTFEFAAHPEVCGDGESFVQIGHSFIGHLRREGVRGRCTHGPVQVRLERRGGEVTRLRWWAGVSRQRPESRDLGAVSAREAADYLLGLAARGTGKVAEEAITPAVLADGAVVWPALLAIARDRETRPRPVRQQAAHWLGRFAQARLLGHPADLGVEPDEGELLRDSGFGIREAGCGMRDAGLRVVGVMSPRSRERSERLACPERSRRSLP